MPHHNEYHCVYVCVLILKFCVHLLWIYAAYKTLKMAFRSKLNHLKMAINDLKARYLLWPSVFLKSPSKKTKILIYKMKKMCVFLYINVEMCVLDILFIKLFVCLIERRRGSKEAGHFDDSSRSKHHQRRWGGRGGHEHIRSKEGAQILRKTKQKERKEFTL